MVFRVVQKSFDSRLGERPCSSVKRFFLTPYDGLGVWVRVEVFFQLLPWEGIELLDAGNSCVLDVVVGAVLL
jgi:hypothetical protein